MMKRITLKGGPHDGKTYDVPHGAAQIPAQGGTYRLTKNTAKWEPTKSRRGATESATATDETKAN